MKNIEKYEKEITEYVNKGGCMNCAIATVAGLRETTPCIYQECDECENKSIKWMFSEYKEQILTDDEKDVIRSMLDVISKFGGEVFYACKYEEYAGETGNSYILIKYNDKLTKFTNAIESPRFRNDMFKEMDIGRTYTLEELGIEMDK